MFTFTLVLISVYNLTPPVLVAFWSHWVHFTVHSLDLFVFICVYFVLLFFILYCIYVVLLWWGGPSGIEAWSLGLIFLQCFDTVGWVFWPIKPVPDMTYYVFGGTLNFAQLQLERQLHFDNCLLNENTTTATTTASDNCKLTLFLFRCGSVKATIWSLTCKLVQTV